MVFIFAGVLAETVAREKWELWHFFYWIVLIIIVDFFRLNVMFFFLFQCLCTAVFWLNFICLIQQNKSRFSSDTCLIELFLNRFFDSVR